MEIKELYPFVLLVLITAMLIGAGVLALDKFGVQSRTSTAVVDETFTADNESCVDLANEYITTTSVSFENQTGVSPATSCFAWDSTGTFAGTCVTLDNGCIEYNGLDINASYNYGATSATTTALSAGATEVSNISTNWLGLVVTIAILAIIIVLIVQGFGGTNKR